MQKEDKENPPDMLHQSGDEARLQQQKGMDCLPCPAGPVHLKISVWSLSSATGISVRSVLAGLLHDLGQ